MLNNQLTDTAIKHAIRGATKLPKPKKLFDGQGLFLLLKPSGAALWRFKFEAGRNADGKPIQNTLSFGAYPEVPLKDARQRRQEARALVASGVNPAEERKKAKAATVDTFAAVAEEYVGKQVDRLAKPTINKMRWQLREFIGPFVGSKPIHEVTAPLLLSALRRIEARGQTESARKTRQLCGRVFLYGIATGRCERNVAADLEHALKPHVTKNRAAVTDPMKVGELMRALDGYTGTPSTVAALRLAPHVFLRPGELRAGRWAEIDFDAAVWRIPGSRMKMRRDHLVPLSRQSLEILTNLEAITGREEFMFPAIGRQSRPISNNTLGAALRTLGYTSDVMVPHGFRAMASTLLHDLGYVSSDIELQLAHLDSNQVRAAYNRSERIKERTKMMQEWSDHLDTLRAGGNVVSFERKV